MNKVAAVVSAPAPNGQRTVCLPGTKYEAPRCFAWGAPRVSSSNKPLSAFWDSFYYLFFLSELGITQKVLVFFLDCVLFERLWNESLQIDPRIEQFWKFFLRVAGWDNVVLVVWQILWLWTDIEITQLLTTQEVYVSVRGHCQACWSTMTVPWKCSPLSIYLKKCRCPLVAGCRKQTNKPIPIIIIIFHTSELHKGIKKFPSLTFYRGHMEI